MRSPLARQWVGLTLAAWAMPALAFFDHYLSNTIVGQLSRAQTETLVAIWHQALSEKGDGESTEFQLAADRDARATEGTMTPVKTTVDGDQRCRQVRSEFRQAGRQEKWSNWYCRQGDGPWRVRQQKG